METPTHDWQSWLREHTPRLLLFARAQTRCEADAETACWFDDTLAKTETSNLLEQAMKRIPEKFREVMVLKIWGELTFAQVAEALDIPMNTAASRYRYGQEFLKKDNFLSQS